MILIQQKIKNELSPKLTDSTVLFSDTVCLNFDKKVNNLLNERERQPSFSESIWEPLKHSLCWIGQNY